MSFSTSNEFALVISIRFRNVNTKVEHNRVQDLCKYLAGDINQQKWILDSEFKEEEGQAEILADSLEEFCKYMERCVWLLLSETNTYYYLDLCVTNDSQLDEEMSYYMKRHYEEHGALEDELDEDPEENEYRRPTENDMYRQTKEFPVKYSREMISYIKELAQVAVNLDQIGELPQIFTKKLLISMDDGWGYSKFLHCIKRTFSPYYSGDDRKYDVSEQKISLKEGLREWERYPSVMKELSYRLEQKNIFSIASFDLSEWMEELENKEFLNLLRRITQYTTRSICVFRVPYLDRKDLAKVERILSSLMPLRTMVIPPISAENMVLYTKEKIGDKGFEVEEGMDNLLEQWISQEKNAGIFYGYKSLDRMVSDLVYKKALSITGPVKDEIIKRITMNDVRSMLTEDVTDKDPYELLDKLIGMGGVKQKIREIVAQVKMQQALVKQGKDIEPATLHMMFLGNPGTGKTTIARIIGMIFKKEGMLEKGIFYEKQGSDFVQKTIGDSVKAVREACRDGHGNVLFIDEAYGMSVTTSNGTTSDESLPTLIAEMENHRDNMCVILAGYYDEMNNFIKENSGLASRIPHVIEFPNYSKDELLEILFYMIDGKFEYEEAFKKEITDYIMNLPNTFLESKEFSNGRFVRNLYENLWGKAAYRISLSGESEIILKKEDAVSVIQEEGLNKLNDEKPRKIGFI